MRSIKKLLVIIVAVMLSFTLQFRTTLSRGMESGFSLKQLAKNIFVKDAFAYHEDWWYHHECEEEFGEGISGVFCNHKPSPIGCLDPYFTCS